MDAISCWFGAFLKSGNELIALENALYRRMHTDASAVGMVTLAPNARLLPRPEQIKLIPWPWRAAEQVDPLAHAPARQPEPLDCRSKPGGE